MGDSFQTALPMRAELWPVQISDIPPDRTSATAGQVWEAIATLRVSTSEYGLRPP
jgi:hypothetical protein